jgi:hypothetical protein
VFLFKVANIEMRVLVPLFFTCTATAIFETDDPCERSIDELRDFWLSKETGFGQSYSDFFSLVRDGNKLHVRGLDGVSACHETLAIIHTPKHNDGEPTLQRETEISHACHEETLLTMSSTKETFRSDPIGTLDKILLASESDEHCCRPFTEFTDLFMNYNNFYDRLPIFQKREVFDYIDAMWKCTTCGDWEIHAGYARALTLYAGGNHEEAFDIIASIVKENPRFTELFTNESHKYDFFGPAPLDRSLIFATVASDPRLELEYLIHSAATSKVAIYLIGFGVP